MMNAQVKQKKKESEAVELRKLEAQENKKLKYLKKRLAKLKKNK